MTTEYLHKVTITVPEHLINEANHLACICGEFAEDINTFTSADWQDAEGNKYAVISTVVKPKFLGAATGSLPEVKPHSVNANRELAQIALDSLGKPNGLMMIVDQEPMSALSLLGLVMVSLAEDL